MLLYNLFYDQFISICDFLAENPLVGESITTVVRYVLPILALLMLATVLRALLVVQHEAETWGYLAVGNPETEPTSYIPLQHWENIIGRQKTADIVFADDNTISRTHGALLRDREGNWTVTDLDSKGGTYVDGVRVEGEAPVPYGATLQFAATQTVLQPLSPEEKDAQKKARAKISAPIPPWGVLTLLTIFQMLTCLQLIVARGADLTIGVPLSFAGLTALMWLYCLILRASRRVGFEMELIAFFLCSLSLSITASKAPDSVPKQFFAILLGVVGFLVLGMILRDLKRTVSLRWMMATAAVGLLACTLVFGSEKFGATNWISLGGMTIQPSEIAKICYIFAGAAPLSLLFHKRNITLFMGLTLACLGCLALMSDFGTAAIFFITFLVIAFLRSGDFATLALICGGCGAGGMVILSVKPYIANRFAIWGNAWSDASNLGYQQTRTMSASASGGLTGVGAGEGWLYGLGAADTDLVFGMLCEEFGLIIALLAVICIAVLAVFAVYSCRAARSSYYVIAACAASSLMVFQTCLNVFGAVDILPLTGVTMPFVSNGGTAMLASWGLLAFLKAADTRQNASFAVRVNMKDVGMHNEGEVNSEE